MYNRYIPQPDGSYRRNRIQEPAKVPHSEDRPRPPEPIEEPKPEPQPHPCVGCSRVTRNPRSKNQPRNNTSISGFLKQLLPRDFDTEDLIVILLLLLMAGDCREEQNTALLTLVLYLFL